MSRLVHKWSHTHIHTHTYTHTHTHTHAHTCTHWENTSQGFSRAGNISHIPCLPSFPWIWPMQILKNVANLQLILGTVYEHWQNNKSLQAKNNSPPTTHEHEHFLMGQIWRLSLRLHTANWMSSFRCVYLQYLFICFHCCFHNKELCSQCLQESTQE